MEYITYAIKDDIDEIEYIMNTAWISTVNKEWYVTDDRCFIENHVEQDGYIMKYMQDACIVGFLIVRHPGQAEDNLGRYLPDWTKDSLNRVAHMESAAVLPEFRGRGIQRKLLGKAEEAEKERGTEYLMATVHPDNSYSAGNLEQLGYECLLETEKYSGLKRKVMCKKLI